MGLLTIWRAAACLARSILRASRVYRRPRRRATERRLHSALMLLDQDPDQLASRAGIQLELTRTLLHRFLVLLLFD